MEQNYDFIINNGCFFEYPFHGTIAEAKSYADTVVQQTTRDLTVTIKNGKEVARRNWVFKGLRAEYLLPKGAIKFPDGYYSDWIDLV